MRRHTVRPTTARTPYLSLDLFELVGEEGGDRSWILERGRASLSLEIEKKEKDCEKWIKTCTTPYLYATLNRSGSLESDQFGLISSSPTSLQYPEAC